MPEHLDRVAVPATVAAVLAARLEQLPAAERTTLERAAVEGRRFHRGAVTALLPGQLRGAGPEWLSALPRKDLIRPEAAALAGEDAFGFHH